MKLFVFFLFSFFFFSLTHTAQAEITSKIYIEPEKEKNILQQDVLIVQKNDPFKIYLHTLNSNNEDFKGYAHYFLDDISHPLQTNIEIFVPKQKEDTIWNQLSFSDTEVSKIYTIYVFITRDPWTEDSGTSSIFRSSLRVTFDIDTDHDGLYNFEDPDDDNDGVPDAQDAFPLDATEWKDTDHDGIGDNKDSDADNDGFYNFQEKELGTNPLKYDTDGDGVSDKYDAFPLDPTRSKASDAETNEKNINIPEISTTGDSENYSPSSDTIIPPAIANGSSSSNTPPSLSDSGVSHLEENLNLRTSTSSASLSSSSPVSHNESNGGGSRDTTLPSWISQLRVDVPLVILSSGKINVGINAIPSTGSSFQKIQWTFNESSALSSLATKEGTRVSFPFPKTTLIAYKSGIITIRNTNRQSFSKAFSFWVISPLLFFVFPLLLFLLIPLFLFWKKKKEKKKNPAPKSKDHSKKRKNTNRH